MAVTPQEKLTRTIEETQRLAGLAQGYIEKGEANYRQARTYLKKIDRNIKQLTGEDHVPKKPGPGVDSGGA